MLSSLLSLLVLAAPPSSEGWASYSNARYGYSIGIPPGLVGQGESDNGDGQQFQDASGKARLRVWASMVVELDGEPDGRTGLASSRRSTLEEWRKLGVRVTYEPRGKQWCVLSGEDPKGRVRYLKLQEKDGVVYAFEWSHPRGAKHWQDATAEIARRFRLP